MAITPNYFDESQFSGYAPREGFFAEKALKGHYNGAAKLHMTWPAPGDTEADKLRKMLFFEKWKDWRACLDASVTKTEKTAFHYLLRKPEDFLGFIWEIPKEVLIPYFQSYQAYLWNKLLKKIMALDPVEESLQALKLPLFSQNCFMPDLELEKLWQEVLAEEKISSSLFLETKFKKVRFLAGSRPAVKTTAG